jgi:hypothetical protein
MDDTERRRTAPNLVTFVKLPLRNDAREVEAGRSRQSCSLEVCSATLPISLGLIAAAIT